MFKPFDATTRALIELGPIDWLRYLGIPAPDPSRVSVIDSNVSTVTAEADKVVRIEGEEPLIVHTEFLAAREHAQVDRRIGIIR